MKILRLQVMMTMNETELGRGRKRGASLQPSFFFFFSFFFFSSFFFWLLLVPVVVVVAATRAPSPVLHL